MITDSPLFVVLGATGHIGSAVAHILLAGGSRVRVVTRRRAKADAWRALSAEAVVGDVREGDTLRRALAGEPVRVFALNPPGSITGDPDLEEDETSAAIVRGLAAAEIDRVVGLSTYGARPGDRIGDLGTLHRFEERLSTLSAPVAIVRAGYLFSNWDGAVDAAKAGRLPVMLDPDRPLPMVAPVDVARAAVQLLIESAAPTGTCFSEGPARLTPRDVAEQFAAALGRPVAVEWTPAAHWAGAFEAAGFSPAAVATFVGLNTVVDRETWVTDAEPVRGVETFAGSLRSLLAARPPSP